MSASHCWKAAAYFLFLLCDSQQNTHDTSLGQPRVCQKAPTTPAIGLTSNTPQDPIACERSLRDWTASAPSKEDPRRTGLADDVCRTSVTQPANALPPKPDSRLRSNNAR